MLVAAVSALHGQPLFEGASGFGDEELRGKPKLVRVEREKLDAELLRLPEEECAYRATQQPLHSGDPSIPIGPVTGL